MKKLILLLGAGLFFVGSLAANAAVSHHQTNPHVYLNPHPYIRVDAGVSWSRHTGLTFPGTSLSTDTDASPIFGAGFGYVINKYLRTDLTLSYRSGYFQKTYDKLNPVRDTSEATIKSLVGLVNAYWDIIHVNRFVPYVGAGIGFARNMLSAVEIHAPNGAPVARIDNANKTNFAWQLTAGTQIQLTQHLGLDVAYHYIDMGKFESDNNLITSGGVVVPGRDKGHLKANEVVLGLRYCF